jgi:hypothetical protein
MREGVGVYITRRRGQRGMHSKVRCSPSRTRDAAAVALR